MTNPDHPLYSRSVNQIGPPRPLKGLDHAVKHIQTSRDLSRMVAALSPLAHLPESELAVSQGPSAVSAWDLTSDPPNRLPLRADIGPVKMARLTRDGCWILAAGERGYAVRHFSTGTPGERAYPFRTFWSTLGLIPEGRDYQLVLHDGVLQLADLARLDAGAVVLATDVTDFVADSTGERLVTLGPAGMLKAYRLRAPGNSMSEQLQPLLDQAEATLGRNPTLDEWTRYLPDTPYRRTFPRLPGARGWND